MSSALQSFLSTLQQANYVSLATLAAVVYDYVLVFPREIEYIWNKPWTWVSILFVMVRYCGLYNVACGALFGSTFIPGPAMIHLTPIKFIYLSCKILVITEYWTYVLFVGAADFIMILRVQAMYNRSRTIFGILLSLYFIVIISWVVVSVSYTNADNEGSFINTVQILDYSSCVAQLASPVGVEVAGALQITFSAGLCILAIVAFAQQSLQVYRITGQWQLNQYVNLLVSQGVIYFFAVFFLNLVDVLLDTGRISSTMWQLILGVMDVPVFTVTPRFVISIREMYARDVRGGRGGGIDTGFGLSTISSLGGAAGGPMTFATNVQSDAEVVENMNANGERDGRIQNVDSDFRTPAPVA